MNSSDNRPLASHTDDPAKPDGLGSATTHLSRPMAPTFSAAAAAGEPTAVWSISPGFCGCSNSSFGLQAVTSPSAITEPATAHRARIVCLIEYRPRMGFAQYLRLSRSVKYVGKPVV